MAMMVTLMMLKGLGIDVKRWWVSENEEERRCYIIAKTTKFISSWYMSNYFDTKTLYIGNDGGFRMEIPTADKDYQIIVSFER